MNINGGQDWDTVVIRKKAPKAGTVNKDKVVNDALRAGAQIEAVKKFGAGANKVTGAGKDAAKLDRETEELHHDRCVALLFDSPLKTLDQRSEQLLCL